jgi:predicted amidohydrolase YtcJ
MRTHSFALTAALFAATPAVADVIVDNFMGYQVDKEGRIRSFDGLVIGDDGKVKIVLTPGARRPGPVVQIIDMGGKVLLPGLIDAHGHVIDSPGQGLGLGLTLARLDLAGSSSLQDMLQRLRNYAVAKPNDPWVLGRGWNQELWPDKRFPTAADIDSVVADRPVMLDRVDGHAVVVNSAALRAAGITAATADPVGGKIERDASGKPTGLLIDAASELVGTKVPPLTPEQFDDGLMRAQKALLGFGVTAVADTGTSEQGLEAFLRAAQEGRLQMRIISYAMGLEPLARFAPTGPTEWLYNDRLRLVGVKFYTDGALGSRGAWLKRPYADKPDTTGLRFMSDAELREQTGKAAGLGFQLAVHAIGDAANEQAISVFEELGKTYTGDRRWRIEHVQVVDPTDIPRIARAGIIASMQPTHQTSDRLMAEKRLDPPRLEGAYAWQTIAKSGARLAFGSDFPVESPNPFPGLAAAITRQDMAGHPPGGWRPEERVSLAQALDGFTRGAAYAGFAEDRIGSLEPGTWADFIIVDRDPTKVNAQALARTEVLETWVAGKKVWSKALSGAPAERGR